MEILREASYGQHFGQVENNEGMFNRKTRPNIIRDLKQLVLKKFNLPESTILSIAELSCHEPGCPPTETDVTAREADGRVTNWRIHKPITKFKK